MAIRIKVNNVVLEVDSESDLRTALGALGALPDQASVNGRTAAKPSDPLGQLAKSLPPNQKTVLKLLASSDEAVTDAEILKALGMETNLHLAGVMSGLVKNAKRVGLTLADLLIKGEQTNGSGNRAYTYQITAVAREHFRRKQRTGKRSK